MDVPVVYLVTFMSYMSRPKPEVSSNGIITGTKLRWNTVNSQADALLGRWSLAALSRPQASLLTPVEWARDGKDSNNII